MLNVESWQFLSGGTVWFSWATSAALTEAASALAYTFTGDENSFTLSPTTNYTGKYVFISGNGIVGNAMHVDGGTATNFQLVGQTGGCYHIRAVAADGTYGSAMANYEKMCWGWNSDVHATGVYATVNPDNGFHCDWLFLTAAQASDASAIALYRSRLALYRALLKAAAEGADWSEAGAVYDNASATVTQIDNAVTALNEVRYAHAMEVATRTTPSDITEFVITNPYPTYNATGWTITNADGEAAAAPTCNPLLICAEFWNRNGVSLRQTLTDLPAGYYTLTSTAFSRTGKGGVLTANDKTTPLVEVGSESVNNLTAANTWFNAGNGQTDLTFRVLSTDETTTIGLKAGTVVDYWTVWRGFELKYLGADPADMTLAEKLAVSPAMYLYNPASGKFLSRGDDYGTRAVVDDYGLPFLVEASGENIRLKFIDNGLYLGAPGNNADSWGYADVPVGDRVRDFELTADGDADRKSVV